MTGGALLVTRVGSTKTDQLDGAVQALRAVDANVLGVVANRVRKKKKSTYAGYYTAQPSGWRHRSAVKEAMGDTQTILRPQ
jgi:Mrp family chromosome partitioning ATPase